MNLQINLEKIKKLSVNNFFSTVIIPLAIFWLILFFLEYPNPNTDDLFFLGAPINLAEKGELVNPFLRFWHERGHNRYFLHPPFYPYTLGFWLSIWGISAKSILFFQCLCQFFTCVSAALILRHYGFPKIATYLIILIYAIGGRDLGLRYDALAMTYLNVGLWFLIKDTQLRYFGGFSFLGAAILTSPVTITYAIPLSFAIVTANYLTINKFSKSYFFKRIGALICAFIFIFTLFLIFINFQLFQFLDDISWHATVSGRTTSFECLLYIWNFLSRNHNFIFVAPLYLLYFFLLGLCIFKKKHLTNSLKWFVISIHAAIIFNIMIYVQSGGYNSWMSIVMILIITSLKLNKKFRLLLYSILFSLYFIGQTTNIIKIVGQESISQVKYEEVRNTVNKMTDKTIFVDEIAARYVFDYRLPKGAINFGASNPPPNVYPTSIKDKKPDQVWVISPVKGKLIEGLSGDYPRVKILGHQFNTLPKKPYDVMIVD